MNRLSLRMLYARANNEIINYYIEFQRVAFINPRMRGTDQEISEVVNDVDVKTMQSAVKLAGLDVAVNVQTIWS